MLNDKEKQNKVFDDGGGNYGRANIHLRGSRKTKKEKLEVEKQGERADKNK